MNVIKFYKNYKSSRIHVFNLQFIFVIETAFRISSNFNNSISAMAFNCKINGDNQCKRSTSHVILQNPHLREMDQDILYHLALGTKSHDLVKMFHDVKFVCMGGSAHRMEEFAHFIMKEIDFQLPAGTSLMDLTKKSNRFSMYKVGPVLSVNHGMGVPSCSILLIEMIKLMHYAGCENPIFFRLGTSGGIGLEPGSVVVSDSAVNGLLKPTHQVPVLGKLKERSAIFDKSLVQEIVQLSKPEDGFQVTSGITMCADDFYEGQGRLDGAFCDYSLQDKMDFLHRLRDMGVKNIEMEATAFAALTHEAGIRAADVCVTLVDRLNGDQISTPKEVLLQWESRPQIIVGRYIKQQLHKN